MSQNTKDKIEIIIYRWAGKFGPFKIKIPCGECALTRDIVQDILSTELANIPTSIQTFDWLTVWWKPLLKGGYHAPIVQVDGKIVSQGQALNRGLFIQAVIESYSKKSTLSGNHIFGKENCPFCQKAKKYFEQNKLSYQFHNVVKNEQALYEMLARVKPIIGPKTHITVPQVWLEGQYIGGSDKLKNALNIEEDSTESGAQCAI
jgi:glutaredoxin